MTAREHAVIASELLASEERYARQLEALTPEQRLQMVATGAVRQSNADREWTVALAQAHAVTALALASTENVLAWTENAEGE
jgi:hypothetical protein